MSPIGVDVALENVAKKHNDLEIERLDQPQSTHRSVRLYETALDILDIEKALGVSPCSPSMFTDPSERIYDCRASRSSTNLLATVEKDAYKKSTNLSQFGKYCYTGVDTRRRCHL